MESLGFRRCQALIEIMKKTNQEEFTETDVKKFIIRYIGFSKLSQERYFTALQRFGMIRKLENGNYVLA